MSGAQTNHINDTSTPRQYVGYVRSTSFSDAHTRFTAGYAAPWGRLTGQQRSCFSGSTVRAARSLQSPSGSGLALRPPHRSSPLPDPRQLGYRRGGLRDPRGPCGRPGTAARDRPALARPAVSPPRR